MITLKRGQTWFTKKRSREITDLNVALVSFCHPNNPDKTWDVTPGAFKSWVYKYGAELVDGQEENKR